MKIDTKYLMYAALACGVAYLVLEARKNKTLGSIDHAESIAHRAIDFGLPLVKMNPILTTLVGHGLKHIIANSLFKGR